MKNKLATFEEEGLYHVYNRANGNESLFRSEDNYRYFLRKYEEYISPLVDTFCYCLMPNHFHFLLKIKEEKDLKSNLLKDQTLPEFQTLAEFNYGLAISKKFENFFSSYTQAFNKVHQRKGSLFMKPFKRKRIDDEKYLRKLIHYIHYNPLEAGLIKEISAWKYSSYPALISNLKTNLSREEVIGLFDSRSNFIYCHQTPPSISGIEGNV